MKNAHKIWNYCSYWLKSYFSVILVIAIISLGYSILVIFQLKQDTIEKNRALAQHYSASLEKQLTSFHDYSRTLLYSNSARQLHSYTKETIKSEEALEHAYNLVLDIHDYSLLNETWSDVYIYYPEIDFLIGKKGAFSSYSYFKAENVGMLPLEEEYQKWMESLFLHHSSGYQLYTEADGTGRLYYCLDISNNGSQTDNRMLVAAINKDILEQSFREILLSASYQYVALVDDNGYIYAQAGSGQPFLNDEGRFAFWNSDDSFVVYRSVANSWPLSFISVQDYGTAFKTVRRVSLIIAAGILLALLVGFAIALYHASKRKSEVDKLAGKFNGNLSEENGSGYDYIETEIDKLFQLNQQAVEAADQQQKIIISAFLQEILHLEKFTEKDVEHIGSIYNISLENSLLSLIIINFKDDSNYDGCINDMEALISNYENDSFMIYWTKVDSLLVMLCNYECAFRSKQGPVLEFVKQIRNTLGDRYEVRISSVMNSSSEIGATWHQMYRQMVPQAPSGKATVGKFSVLDQFNDAIEEEDLTSAIKLIPEINENFFRKQNKNITLCQKYTIVEKLYESFPSEFQASQIDELLPIITDDDWNIQLAVVLRKLDQDINQPNDTRDVAGIVMEMIQKEYYNPQLSLHMIAERIGISQSYLSNLFKQKYGIGFVQYLNSVRIEQAKRMIMEGNDNLKVIAMNVGFLSDVNLIRVFKKYEKTTPGKFRNGLTLTSDD